MILIQGNAPGVATELVLSRTQLNSRLLLKSGSTALLAQRNTCFGSIEPSSLQPDILCNRTHWAYLFLPQEVKFPPCDLTFMFSGVFQQDLDVLPHVYLFLRGEQFHLPRQKQVRPLQKVPKLDSILVSNILCTISV